MKPAYNKHGYTLLEVLVATTIIIMIVMVVYAAYFAVSQSALRGKNQIAQCHQAQYLLGSIAQSIRCAYQPQRNNNQSSKIYQAKQNTKSMPTYLYGNPDNEHGVILELVTTASLLHRNNNTAIVKQWFKYDAHQKKLFYLQHEWFGDKQNINPANWQEIGKNIDALKLTYYDGKRWLNMWDSQKSGRLPNAVSIEMIIEADNSIPRRFETIAYVHCSLFEQPKS